MERIAITKFIPNKLLAFYQTDDGGSYIESHRLSRKGEVLEGKPLNKRELVGFASAILKKYKTPDYYYFEGLIPKNVLIFKQSNNGLQLAWVAPKRQVPMAFRKDLGIPDGQVWHPPILFHWDGRRLCVYWLKQEVEVTQDTTLYLAPYHNVDSGGGVCAGNAIVRKSMCLETLMVNIENMFYLSRFSHAYDTLCESIPFNLNTFWRDRINRPYNYPDSAFIKSRQTIQDLISNDI